MGYRLSLLDKSPVPDGVDAAEALARTVVAAQSADRLGYYRFWIAEHHGNPRLASATSSPCVILAVTQRGRGPP